MKRGTFLKLMGLLIGASIVGSTSGVLAWFHPTADISTADVPLNGTAEGAYFAYGDGSSLSQAYGISKPRHLYNLAWLTYLGYFSDKQTYFELAQDIDMDGWVLPPIGTTKYPFVGNFNGKDHIVSNCAISNSFADYGRKHPGSVTTDNFQTSTVKIVGFFGVIGEYPGDSYSGSYSSQVNTAHDFGLSNVSVSTSSPDTLIGMAAGYVNAEISDIAVDAGSLTVETAAGTTAIAPASKISEHAIVGYTNTKKEIRKVDETIYTVNVSTGDGTKNWEFNAVDQGSDAGWGGSIDMKSVTKRLQTIRSGITASNNYAYKRTYDYHDGVKDDTYTTTATGTNSRTFLKTDNDEIGHFNFIHDDDGTDNTYALLGGGHYETSRFYVQTVHSGHKIHLGTNYLNFNTNTTRVQNGNSEVGATIWMMPAVGSTGTISYSYAGTTYYLRNNAGTLEVSNNSTNWTITDRGNDQVTISNGNYKIHYYQNAWRLIPTQDREAEDYYIITDGTNYLVGGNSNGSGVSNTTSQSSATRFYVEEGTNNVYHLSGSTKLYLAYYRNSGISTGIRSNTSKTADYPFYYTNGSFVATRNGNRYYPVYSSSWFSSGWSTTTSSDSAATVQHIQTPGDSYGSMYLSPLIQATSTGPDEYLKETKQGMNYDEENVTYFPLNTINNTSDFRPADTNTAYVIGGSTITNSTNTYSDRLTNVRFGRYEISGKISSDYSVTTGKFNHVYTINDSLGMSEITDDSQYEKLTDAKNYLGKVLKDDGTYVYGLHFMRAPISLDATTKVDYLKVNREEFENYQLPVNSIDFHLKEFGYINFMSGSYFTGNSSEPRNDSFFDLYQIERDIEDSTKINRILKIKNVYQHSSKAKNVSYVYQLEDTATGAISYTKPYKIVDAEGNREWLDDSTTPYAPNQYVSSLPSGYSSVFNTSRIGINNVSERNFNNHVFYFEIPMNDGEFCLGAVGGGSGCYLMYLDIGANAAKTQRTIISEHFTSEEKVFVYPVGVSFHTYDATLDDTDSASMTVPTGFAGRTLTVSRDGDVLTVKENDAVTLTGDLVYLGDELSIADNIRQKLKPKESSQKEIRRLQYFDYNVNLETTSKTIITDTYLNGASTPTRTIEQFNLLADGSWSAVDADKIKIFRTNNGIAYDLATIDTAAEAALDAATASGGLGWTNPGNTVLLSVEYNLAEGSEATSTFTLEMQVDSTITDGHYFAFKDYAFLIEATGSGFDVTVLTKGSGTVTINDTPVTAAGQVITVSAGS